MDDDDEDPLKAAKMGKIPIDPPKVDEDARRKNLFKIAEEEDDDETYKFKPPTLAMGASQKVPSPSKKPMFLDDDEDEEEDFKPLKKQTSTQPPQMQPSLLAMTAPV